MSESSSLAHVKPVEASVQTTDTGAIRVFRPTPGGATEEPLAHAISWPSDEHFRAIQWRAQLQDGSAVCTRMAFCNEQGEFRSQFDQNEVIHVFVEFHARKPIDNCGYTLKLSDGFENTIWRIGRSSLPGLPSSSVEADDLIRLHEVIPAGMSPGTWDLDASLISTNVLPTMQSHAAQLDVEDLLANSEIHCSARPENYSLSITGLEDAAPVFTAQVVPAGAPLKVPMWDFQSWEGQPPLYHITHWKAGSQWIYNILRDLFHDQVMPAYKGNDQLLWPDSEGRIFPTLYMTREKFETYNIPTRCKKLIVLRDPRDTLISLYFSQRSSHVVQDTRMAKRRDLVNRLSQEEGLEFMMELVMPDVVRIQKSWLDSNEKIYRYEDLIADEGRPLKDVLLRQLNLPIDPELVDRYIDRNRFEKISGGRKQGQKNENAHYRNGQAGDWKNYFTPRLTQRFKALFGDVLIQAGYEADHNWTAEHDSVQANYEALLADYSTQQLVGSFTGSVPFLTKPMG